jgi:uncharacterized LabA/DUF88 family protein
MLKSSQKSTIVIDAECFQSQLGNHHDTWKLNEFLEESLRKIQLFAGSEYEIFSTISIHNPDPVTTTRLNSISAQMLSVNGNRDGDIRMWMRSLAKHIRDVQPGQVIIVTNDDRFARLIDYISGETYVRVWYLGEKVSPALLASGSNSQPFDAVLPELKAMPIEKSAVFVDYENVIYALLDNYNAELQPEQVYQAVVDAVGQSAETVKFFFYADYGAIARKYGDARKSLDIINFLVMRNVEVIPVVNRRGKNGADIRISLDTIALAKQGLYKRLGIVSCDSDFSALFDNLKDFDVSTLLIGVRGVTSQISRQAAKETRYLDDYLPNETLFRPSGLGEVTLPTESLAQREQIASTLLKLDNWRRKNRWTRFFIKNRLRGCPNLQPEEHQAVEQFLREGWLIQAEGEPDDCVCFNVTMELIRSVLYLVGWLPNRIEYLHNDNNGRPMSYVDTDYLVRGMAMGKAQERLAALLDYLPGETWLRLTAGAGIVHQEVNGNWETGAA